MDLGSSSFLPRATLGAQTPQGGQSLGERGASKPPPLRGLWRANRVSEMRGNPFPPLFKESCFVMKVVMFVPCRKLIS